MNVLNKYSFTIKLIDRIRSKKYTETIIIDSYGTAKEAEKTAINTVLDTYKLDYSSLVEVKQNNI